MHPDAKSRARSAAAAAVCAAAACAAAIAAHLRGVPLCPLMRATGLPCPSCGTTRAVLMALRGDFAGAFAMQPLASALLFAAAPALAVAACAAGPARVGAALRSAMSRKTAKAAAAAAVAANWIYVLLNGN